MRINFILNMFCVFDISINSNIDPTPQEQGITKIIKQPIFTSLLLNRDVVKILSIEVALSRTAVQGWITPVTAYE